MLAGDLRSAGVPRGTANTSHSVILSVPLKGIDRVEFVALLVTEMEDWRRQLRLARMWRPESLIPRAARVNRVLTIPRENPDPKIDTAEMVTEFHRHW